MRQFIILALGLALLAGCGQVQEGYRIEGSVKGQTEGQVYLKLFRNKMYFNVDTAEIVDGRFTFEGEVEQPLLYALSTDQMASSVQLFLENKTLPVTLDTKEKTVAVTGSVVNDIFLSNADRVHAEGFSIDSLVTAHPDSPAAAFYLYRYFTYQLPLEELKATRAKLSPALSASPYVGDLDKIISKLENIQIGKPAPDFSLPDTLGNSVRLADFRGKYVLIDFWAGWCPHCRKENPNVVAAYEKFKARNFTVVGVSLDRDRKTWTKAIVADKLPWTQVSDLKYWDSEIPELYGIRAIPANVLIDPEGVIVAKDLREAALHEALEKTLPQK